MPEIPFRINPHFLQALREVLEPIEKRLRLQVAVNLDGAPDDDEELLDAWRDSLLEQLRADVDILVAFLSQLGPDEPVRLSEDEAESALRAASAVRLKIREAFLTEISEEALEMGDVDLASLSPEQHKPFACYGFLASFQETIVSQLMPDFYEDIWADEDEDA